MKNLKFVFVCLGTFASLFPLLDGIVEKIHSHYQKIPLAILYLFGYIMFPIGTVLTSLFVLKEKTKELIVTYVIILLGLCFGFYISVLLEHLGYFEWFGIMFYVFPGMFMMRKVVPFENPMQPFRQVILIAISLLCSPFFFGILLNLFAPIFSRNNPMDFWILVQYLVFFVFVCSGSIGLRFVWLKRQKGIEV
jgi:hypothetical protein